MRSIIPLEISEVSIVKLIFEPAVSIKTRFIIDRDGEQICVVHAHQSWYGFSAHCTHIGVEIVAGSIKDYCITCPLHSSKFDIRYGDVLQGPARQSLKVYPIIVREGWICLDTLEKHEEITSFSIRACLIPESIH